MKIRTLLSVLLLTSGTAGLCTEWTVTNSGFSFSPDTLTIVTGDTVIFNVASIHNSIEVSQMSWNSNDNTPLTGGWSLPLGGGTLLPADLTVGTHYYVCGPHASSGMKGVIIVESNLGLNESEKSTGVEIFPNPSDGIFNVRLSATMISDNTTVGVFDIAGNLIEEANITGPLVAFDLSDRKAGAYFIRINTGEAVLSERVTLK